MEKQTDEITNTGSVDDETDASCRNIGTEVLEYEADGPRTGMPGSTIAS